MGPLHLVRYCSRVRRIVILIPLKDQFWPGPGLVGHASRATTALERALGQNNHGYQFSCRLFAGRSSTSTRCSTSEPHHESVKWAPGHGSTGRSHSRLRTLLSRSDAFRKCVHTIGDVEWVLQFYWFYCCFTRAEIDVLLNDLVSAKWARAGKV